MTQQITTAGRAIHITDQQEISPTCETLCDMETEFTACLTIDQYMEFKKQGHVDPQDWCEQCVDRSTAAGVLLIRGIPARKKDRTA